MWIDGRGSMVLDRPECLRLVAVSAEARSVGRLAFVVADGEAPVVLPVNFRLHAGELFFRIGRGLISESAAGHLVAFEVDHIDPSDREAWSVLVRGFARLVALPDERQLEATGQPLVPEPGDMMLVLRPDVVTGRRFGLS